MSNLESSEDRLFNLEIGRDRLFRLHKNFELNHCSEVMLWIWQLSHLGDSEARLFSLGSKARLVVSHFLLVLPVTGFAPNSSTAIHHRRNGWNSSCCSVC